jgi:hypothetical protein
MDDNLMEFNEDDENVKEIVNENEDEEVHEQQEQDTTFHDHQQVHTQLASSLVDDDLESVATVTENSSDECDSPQIRSKRSITSHHSLLAEEDLEHLQHEERQESERSWMERSKNILVFSRAGKPVYSSGADELELSSVFSLLQAMLARTGDRLRVIRAGKGLLLVFAIRGPLMLAVASRKNEPIGYLQLQLEYIYAQILVHITFSALDDTFRRKPGYDLRGLLGGTRPELEGVIESAESSPAMMLAAVNSLHIPTDVRAAATSVLYSVRQNNLLYAILLADDKLVTQISPKRHPLKASDLLLLINFVSKAKQLRTQETWTPLCLPGFDATGFLHAYAAFVSEHICLLFLSSGESLEQFHYCSQSKAVVAEQLARQGVASRIEAASLSAGLAPTSCEAIFPDQSGCACPAP